MTLTTFQKLLSELLAQYNQEAENHYVDKIELRPTLAPPHNYKAVPEKVLFYEIEIKTIGK